MNLRALILLPLVVLLFSCSDDDNPTDENPVIENPLLNHPYPQKWELFKTKGAFEGSEATGEDMEWQETYMLYSDSTFTKTRVKKNGTMTGHGTFSIVENEGEVFFSLTYTDKDNPIIVSCSGNNEEHLYFRPDEEALINGAVICDWGSSFYKIVK
ncbi:hypothetical protein [Sinomicrobium weinanense]|uniref:Lipocalin-like domain-containing protein n=1 Tax=Sinomicrobium weinanense TaxID=2842200 RepID=A0A926JP83_9FLAO|nr:hypothetical protein [Sinomicrobium weinanense]MBC9794866.1 hypothetical protein [Sinomicrobium weinanense]MBU3125637.1 hypothetical protein [Sinomicrobium weinanense]